MRQDYEEYRKRETVIISIGPETREAFISYWHDNDLPFIGLPDPKHSVLKLYGQEVKLFKLGRQPAQMIIDKKGTLRYIHYGHNMSDIPTTKDMITLLDTITNGL